MDRLPEELLVAVFKIHVWCNLDSPQRLLRVCRRWHNIANNTGSLWGNIVFTDEDAYPYESGYHPDPSLVHKTHCNSIKSLARAIERTKASKFELTLDIMSPVPCYSHLDFELLNPSWFSRCRALSIYKYDLEWPEDLLNNLGALERLDINTDYQGTMMHTTRLLEVAHRTTPLLWHLSSRGSSHVALSQYPKLAARLTVLELTAIHLYSGFILDLAPCSSLETLIWKVGHGGTSLRIHGPFPPKLHTLSTTGDLLVLIPPELYSGLRTISFSNWHNNRTSSGLGQTYEFPMLQHLEINGLWNSMADIRAPSLQSLVLLDRLGTKGMLKRRDDIGRLKKTPLRPKKLNIDVRLDEADLRSLLSEVCEDLEELQIVYVEPDLTLRNPLTQGFLGMKRCPAICPMLRRLTVTSTTNGNSKRVQESRLRSEERLKKVADARMGGGVLEHVTYGWCQYAGSREHPIRKETVEWSQILVR
jgi:F-box-like